MGDRYELYGKKCGHCGATQEDVYYAPSSGFLTHKCEKCGRQNAIEETFRLRPIIDGEVKEIMQDNGFGDYPLNQ